MSNAPDLPEIGALLPRCSNAVAPPDKFDLYCLNPKHPLGRHKAKVFQSALGFGPDDGGALRTAIIEGLQESPVVDIDDERRPGVWECTVDIAVNGPNGQRAVVRTIWEATKAPKVPRLLTLFVKKSGSRAEVPSDRARNTG